MKNGKSIWKGFAVLPLLGVFVLSVACGKQYDPQDAKSMIQALHDAVGGKERLLSLKDVQFTYTYDQVSKGTKDISVERYRFADEASWARYSVHEENVAPNLEGEVTQSLYQGKATFKHKGEELSDPALLGVTTFLRHANYFWFTMMFKLSDPQVIAEVLPRRTVDAKTYDVVKVTYDPAVTGKEQNDIYILYFNPETHLVDRFLFSLPAFGVNEPVLLFDVEYTRMQGIQVITKRTMYGTDGQGNKQGEAQLIQTISDVKFTNGFTKQDLI